MHTQLDHQLFQKLASSAGAPRLHPTSAVAPLIKSAYDYVPTVQSIGSTKVTCHKSSLAPQTSHFRNATHTHTP